VPDPAAARAVAAAFRAAKIPEVGVALNPDTRSSACSRSSTRSTSSS
jgi:hypothetical protein